MSDSIALLTILALFMTTYVILMWVVRLTNERGDEIVAGVVKGIPTPRKTRSLMLYTQYLPYCAFGLAFLTIMGLGILEIARGVEAPRVSLIGYMCATMLGASVLFIGVLVPFLFADMRAAVRKSP